MKVGRGVHARKAAHLVGGLHNHEVVARSGQDPLAIVGDIHSCDGGAQAWDCCVGARQRLVTVHPDLAVLAAHHNVAVTCTMPNRCSSQCVKTSSSAHVAQGMRHNCQRAGVTRGSHAVEVDFCGVVFAALVPQNWAPQLLHDSSGIAHIPPRQPGNSRGCLDALQGLY